jgi:fumarate reductase subunit D
MKKLIYGAMVFLPTLAFAAIGKSLDLVTDITNLIGKLVPLLIALAMVYFFWGLVKFIQGAGDPKKTAEGKGIMIYGILALAVMFSMYGLIRWLQTQTGLEDNSALQAPKLPTN